ncbi:MAG: hypothetical protein MI862_27185 [Desulfobacterales bacterium]|nr:hypothetical protein [Desulfobacterales bacterium]
MAEEKIVVDVLTLDSVQCAACGYMMESMAAMPEEVQALIEYKEHSIKNKAGIGKFMELKGKVLPSIAIEGDIVFPSIIPQYEELIDEMVKRTKNPEIVEKLKAARETGFQFDKLGENLDKAGAGKNTRSDS